MQEKIDVVQTKDGVTYKVERSLFSKYSRFYTTMIQDS